MRRNWLLAAVALAMSVSTSGCGVVLLGNASPVLQTRYGFEMSQADQYLTDSAAFVRSLDPCGFLTEDDLTALGTVVQLRPDGELSTCTAELARTTASGRSRSTDSVTVDLDSYEPSSEDSEIEQITIGGQQVYRDTRTSSSCRITFPLRTEFAGTDSEMMDGFRTEHGRSFATIDVSRMDEDSCTSAERVTETALGLLDDPPLRADSKYNLPLAATDPCGVLEHLPATWTVDRWDPDSDPYNCVFTASSETLDESFIMLIISLVYVDTDRNSTDTVAVRQGGYTVYPRDSDSSCAADVTVGNPVLGMPDSDGISDAYARTTPSLSVTADDCDSAVDLAVAAADHLTG
ncbi:MAG: hypothetical protein ACOH2Q_16735 [Rhodococcus sp. (in: high G+C Gram-positive bacteria)]